MKELNKLTKSLWEMSERYRHLSETNKFDGMNDSALYNEGVRDGIWKAIEEIEQTIIAINSKK